MMELVGEEGAGLVDPARTPLTYIVCTFPRMRCQMTSRGRLIMRTLARQSSSSVGFGAVPTGIEIATRSPGEKPRRGIVTFVCVSSVKCQNLLSMYLHQLLPLILSLGTLDSSWVPTSYSIAFLSSHDFDWRPRGGDCGLASLLLVASPVRVPFPRDSIVGVCRLWRR